MKSNRKFTKNDAAFTGLEAAIVLIAFVVVAAVFSYVMLGAGFFTSQKSKEVVHTGVDQATSSIQTTGDIIATGAGAAVTSVDVTLMLTAGNNPIDMNKLIISYQDASQYEPAVWDGASGTMTWIKSNQDLTAPFDGDDGMLEQFEQVKVHVDLSGLGTALPVNTKFTLEIKPSTGAILPLTFTTGPVIKTKMNLV
jgi:flagellin FlaB